MFLLIHYNPSSKLRCSHIFHSQKALMDLPGIGKAISEAIWDQHAKRRGAMISTAELQKQVTGIGPLRRKKIEKWLYDNG